MTWLRGPAADALAQAFAAAAPLVSVFAIPPATFNVPALICTDPATVTKRQAGFSVDQAEFIVVAAVGLDQADELSELLNIADEAVQADPTLGRAVRVAVVTEYRNYRLLTIAGADYRAADLAVRIDM